VHKLPDIEIAPFTETRAAEIHATAAAAAMARATLSRRHFTGA